MAFTRPRAAQIDFDVTNISDPLIRLNSAETGSADKDVGIVIERGDDTNVAIIYDESADQFVLVNTTETGTTSGNVTISSYADIRAGTFYGDGSGLTGVTNYTDSDVASYLSSNTIATSNINVSGDILPDADNTRSLGSASLQWQEVYIGPGSLYVNGKKVLEESAGTIVVSADPDQSLTVKTTGTGVLTLQSATTVNVASTLQIQSGNSITDSAGTAVAFGDSLDMNSNKITELGTPSASTDAATKGYIDTTVGSYLPLTGGTISSNLTVSGNFTVNGTTTTINTSTLSVADNLIDLNSDVTSGTPSQDAGIRILRGDSNAVQLRWNETNDEWELTTDGSSYANIAVTSDIPTNVSELTNDSGYSTTTGTVTSVAGTGTVNGLTLSGTVTSSGSLTLGGTFSATVSEISDLTATAAELNLLDGVTATAAELNILDGVTATAAELNFTDGMFDNTAATQIIAMNASNNGFVSSGMIFNSSTTSLGIGVASASDIDARLHIVGTGTANTGEVMFKVNNSNDHDRIEFIDEGVNTSMPSALRNNNATLGLGIISVSGAVKLYSGGSTTSDIAIEADSSGVQFSGAYRFPTSDGSANQFLQTDGSGALSFATVTSSFTLAADSGTSDSFSTGGTLTFDGGTGIDTTVSNDQISIAIDSTVATLTGSQTLTNKTLTSPQVNTNIDLLAQADVRFYDADSSNYVGFQSPTTATGNILWTLPGSDGTEGQVLSTNGGGTLTWEDPGSGGGSGSSYPNSTFSTVPGTNGDFDLSYNVAQTTQETPFEAGGTDAFGVNLGSVFSLMDPIGSIETIDYGDSEAYVGA